MAERLQFLSLKLGVKGFWRNVDNQRKYFEDIATELGVGELDGWYDVPMEAVHKRGGAIILDRYYSGSLIRALSAMYPNHRWLVWKFAQVPRGFWDNLHNQRAFFEWLGEEIGIKKLDDWHNVKVDTVYRHGGAPLLVKYYACSLAKALTTVYPHHHWKQESGLDSKGFWCDLGNQRRYLDAMGSQLGVTHHEDWYRIKRSDAHSLDHKAVFNRYYNGCLYHALKTVYKETDWHAWRFAQVPKGFWLDESNASKYVNWLTSTLEINSPEQWYNVGRTQIAALKGTLLMRKCQGMCKMLSKYIPSHKWKHKLLHKHKIQPNLVRLLQKLFPYADVRMNFKHPNLRHSQTQKRIELDVYMPSIGLAFEYQGEQHYVHQGFRTGSGAMQATMDEEKRRLCLGAGIKLIEIPYWWDHQIDTLKATIARYCPPALIALH